MQPPRIYPRMGQGIMNNCADCQVEMGTGANVPVRCSPCIAQRNKVAAALVPPNTGTVYGEAPARRVRA